MSDNIMFAQIAELRDMLQAANDRIVALQDQRNQASDQGVAVYSQFTASQRKAADLEAQVRKLTVELAAIKKPAAEDATPALIPPPSNGIAGETAVH